MLQFAVLSCMISWFFVCCPGVLAYPTTTRIQLPGPGPRSNETGRFRYEDSASPGTYYHCQFCKSRALSDDTYTYMQVPACFPAEGEKWEDFQTPYEKENKKYAICNEGGVPGCGEPHVNHTSDYRWQCERGYSGLLYSVYFTCQLVHKDTNKMVVQLYCNESLVWHEDKNVLHQVNLDTTVTDDPKGQDELDKSTPVKDNPVGQDELDNTARNIIVSCVSVVIATVLVTVFVCFVMRKSKCRLFKDKDAPRGQQPAEVENGGVHNSASTIGTCSLARNGSIRSGGRSTADGPASAPLLPDPNMRQSGRSTATISKKDSCVGTDSPLLPRSEPFNSFENPLESITSRQHGSSLGIDQSLTFVKERLPETSISREPDLSGISEENPQTVVKERVPGTSVGKEPDSFNREPTLESASTDGAQVKVFYDDPNSTTGKSSTPIDNDGGVYEIPLGSTYYIVPSSSNGAIRAFSVERKDDGNPYRGRAQPNIGLTFMHLIVNATEEDGGVFSWTVVLETGEEFHGVIQISINRQEHETTHNISEGRLEPIGSEHGDSDVLRTSRSSTESNDDNFSIPGCDQYRQMPTCGRHLSSSGRSDVDSEHGQGNCKINDLNRESNVAYPDKKEFNSNRNISDPVSAPKLDPYSIDSNNIAANERVSSDSDLVDLDHACVRGERYLLDNIPILNNSTFERNDVDNASTIDDVLNVTNNRAAPTRPRVQNNDSTTTEVGSVGLRAGFDCDPRLDPSTIEDECPSGSRPTPTGGTGSTYDTFSEVHSEVHSEFDDENDERHNTSRKEYASSNNNQPMSDPRSTRGLNPSPEYQHPSGVASLPATDTRSMVRPELIRADHVIPGPVPQGEGPGPVPQVDCQQQGDVHGEIETRPSHTEGRATTPPLALSAQHVPCLTPLSDVTGDDKFIADLGSKGKPQDWIGLKDCLKVSNALLDDVKFKHRNGTVHNGLVGPTNGLVGPTNDVKLILHWMGQEQKRVGDLVRYFCGEGSDSLDIVNFCVDECSKHSNCEYCMNLRESLKKRMTGEARSPGNS